MEYMRHSSHVVDDKLREHVISKATQQNEGTTYSLFVTHCLWVYLSEETFG